MPKEAQREGLAHYVLEQDVTVEEAQRLATALHKWKPPAVSLDPETTPPARNQARLVGALWAEVHAADPARAWYAAAWAIGSRKASLLAWSHWLGAEESERDLLFRLVPEAHCENCCLRELLQAAPLFSYPCYPCQRTDEAGACFQAICGQDPFYLQVPFLPYTTFATLADLGYALPAYREEAVGVEMALPHRAQYDRVDSSLRSMVRRKPRLLAIWLQTTLGRPDTAFREEEIVTRITVGRSGRHRACPERSRREVEEINLGVLPPAVCPGLWRVDGDGRVALDSERDDSTLQRWLPKEQWLAGFCRAEVTAGRRVLVYVRLTGTRDVQDRLRDALGEAGLRAMVLRQEVSPRRRDRWVRKHLPDVLIANPRLVETGLNLVAYATVVFFEIDYSLYTVWQACRRVWRPGQVLPVQVVFVAYHRMATKPSPAKSGSRPAQNDGRRQTPAANPSRA